MKKYGAFTLAEVLITFGIIALVAAMTIPTLLTNSGKSEFKTGFKKSLSKMNQAVTMSVALDYVDFATANAGMASPSIYKILSDRMNVVKVTEGNKVSAVKTMFGGAAKNNYTLFFADGTVLTYPKTNAKCDKNVCIGIIDVNGVRKPNKLSHCQGLNKTASDDDIAVGGACDTKTNLFVSDQYVILFKKQQVVPNGYAAKYIVYEN